MAEDKETKNFEGMATMGGTDKMDKAIDELEAMVDEAEYMPIDRKYVVDLGVNNMPYIGKADGSGLVMDWIIFRAQDKAVVPMLRQYFKICKKLGSPEEHLSSIVLLIERVQAYQNDAGAKVPD